jgi:hypothetical protein
MFKGYCVTLDYNQPSGLCVFAMLADDSVSSMLARCVSAAESLHRHAHVHASACCGPCSCCPQLDEVWRTRRAVRNSQLHSQRATAPLAHADRLPPRNNAPWQLPEVRRKTQGLRCLSKRCALCLHIWCWWLFIAKAAAATWLRMSVTCTSLVCMRVRVVCVRACVGDDDLLRIIV